jgi:hypothetical protein
LALYFFIPIETGREYSAVIASQSGKPVAEPVKIVSYDGRGNFALVFDRRELPAGEYKLTVTDGQGPSRQFSFLFRL